MNRRMFLAGVVMGTGVVETVARGELPRAWVKPRPEAGIPDYAYSSTGKPKPTVTVASLVRILATGVPVTSVPVTTTGTPVTLMPDPLPSIITPRCVPLTIPVPAIVSGVPPANLPAPPSVAVPLPRAPQIYQLSVARMQVEHCFLSRVAVTLQNDGTFLISFRADQNPQPGADLGSPLRPGERGQGDVWKSQTGFLLRNLFHVKVRGYAAYTVSSKNPNLTPGKPAMIEFPLEPFWVQRGQPYSGFVNQRSDDVRRYFDLIDRLEVEFTYT